MPWRRGLQLAWKAVVYAGLSFLCLVVLAWLTLQWGILPHIEDWRPEIERHASRAVGVPVRIGHIGVRSSSWIPALDLRDVVLRDASGAEALRLPRVSAALSPQSLLVLSPRLAQLYIEDARLLVRRDAAGHLHVGGLDLAARATVSSADEAATLDWFFSQDEIVLRRGAVRWIDEQRAAPALELTDVDVVLRNGLRSHDMRIDATPPADWGDRFTLRARTRQPLFSYAGDWRRWTGTFYADLPRGDVAQLKRHVDLPFQLDGGQGSLRLWLDFQNNHWRSATADVQLDGVVVRLSPQADPLAIAHAGGRLSASRDPAGVALAAEHFGFRTAEGVTWPAGDVRLSWQQAQRSVFMRLGRRAFVSRHRDEAIAQATGQPGPAPSPATSSGNLPWDDLAPVTGGALSADHLDLTLMRRLAASLPLPRVARKWLADYQPEGVVHKLDAHWSGPLAAPDVYRVTAAVDGFSMAAGAIPDGARSGRPGWRNAKVTLDANERGGRAHLALDGGSIELPGVFEEPVIPFDRFGADARWTIEPVRGATRPPAISVALDDVRFANADAEGALQLQWQSGPGAAAAAPPPASGASAPSMFGRGQRFPGTIALKGTLAHARADRLARYLPKPGLESTRSYIAAAFAGGDLDNVRFDVRGDLAGFPYQRLHDGDFRIDGHVRGVTLTYAPGAPQADGSRAPSQWPAFTQVAGEVVLDRGALEIHAASGRMGGLRLHDVDGGVKNLYEQAALGLHGQVSGPMTDFLRYVAQSPVGGWLHDGLAATTATGDAELELGLDIPLQHGEQTTVNGALTLSGNDVRLVAGAPVLADARARVAFTEKGVTVSGGHARALGGDVAFDGGTQPDGALRFTAQGTVEAEGLRKVAEEPVLARLASHVDGQAGYRLAIGIAKGQTEFALTSPLTGLGLALPAPLNKPADATWPLTVSTTASLEEGHPRDTLRVALSQPQGPVLQAEVLRDRSGDLPRPIRAAYAVGAPLPPLQPGGVLMLRGPSFNGDAWLALWRGLSAGPAPPAPAAAAATAADDMGISYVPSAAALKTPDLVLGGHHLTNVDVLLAQVVASGDDVWRSNISSDQTKGVVEYRPETPTRGAQLFARLDRLALDSHDAEPDPPAAAASGPAPAAESSQTNSVPALDIVVDNFELNAKKLGRLEVAATAQTGGRDWRLTKLSLTTPEARLSGTGRWSGAPSRHASLDFDLELADSGTFLGRLGMGQVLKRGKGKLAGSVTWTGSPLALDYPSLQGKLRVEIDEGQFLKADAGAGRLLGVLSLQSLPRRFMLDFRDLFSEGFAFDNVTGDVVIERGVASTKDLRMRSATAAVLMSGRADLKAETQDIDVIIVPDVNAGAASLAYAAINPVIGIGTFLAQLFLRSPLTEAGTREVHVTGTWSAPKVDEVEHKAAVAAAAAAASATRANEAAAAASAALGKSGAETP